MRASTHEGFNSIRYCLRGRPGLPPCLTPLSSMILPSHLCCRKTTAVAKPEGTGWLARLDIRLAAPPGRRSSEGGACTRRMPRGPPKRPLESSSLAPVPSLDEEATENAGGVVCDIDSAEFESA